MAHLVFWLCEFWSWAFRYPDAIEQELNRQKVEQFREALERQWESDRVDG